MSDASQKFTDEERGKADARDALLRFAPLPPEMTPLPESKPIPYTGPHPSDWEWWLERRKQIEREEKRAFNEHYGYTQ